MTSLAPTSPRMPTTAPKPGIYSDIGPAEYFRWAAWSQSTLKHIGVWDNTTQQITTAPGKSAAHLRTYLDRGQEATSAQDFGSAEHCLLLERDRFQREYVVVKEPPNRKSDAGKAYWDAVEAEIGKAAAESRRKEAAEVYERMVETRGADRVLTPVEWEELQRMAHAAARNELARDLLAARGQREVSLSWLDPTTGAPMKARLDLLIVEGGKVRIVDPKSTRCSHPLTFEPDIARFGYDVQGAMYTDGVSIVLGIPSEDIEVDLIAIEKGETCCVVVYPLTPETIASGRVKYQAMLAEALRCQKLDKWPGYADDRVIPASLPARDIAEKHDPTEAPRMARREPSRQEMADAATTPDNEAELVEADRW